MKNVEGNYIPVQNLEPDKKEKIKKYEENFDKINSLRLDLALKLKELRTLGFKLDKLSELSDKNVSTQISELDTKDFLNMFGLSDEDNKFNKIKAQRNNEGVLENSIKVTKLKSLFREIKDLDEKLNKQDGFLKEDEAFLNFYRDVIKESGLSLGGKENNERIIMMGINHYEALLEAQLMEMSEFEKKGDANSYKEALIEYQEYKDEFDDFVNSSPEVYYAYYSKYLKDIKDSIDNGGCIIETPYVKKKRDRIIEELNSGRPCFIYGETGSGKTEVARHICKKYLSEEYIKRWENGDTKAGIEAHIKPTDPEELKTWEEERKNASEPLMVSGFSGMEMDILLGGIKITKKEKDFNLLGEETEKARGAIEKFVNEQIEKYGSEYKDSKEYKEDIEMFKEGAKEMMKNPVETIPYVVGVYKAMMEGRPLIIDEVNAIPHHILIILNDLLTAKPGRVLKPMIDNMAPFEVKEGFKVIFTANWRPGEELGDDRYVGRKIMDTAFMNRMALISYDYLPNNNNRDSLRDEGKDREQIRKDRSENELFQMMVSSLMDKNLQVKVPTLESSESNYLEHKIFDLSRASRLFQDIFSGKDIDSATFKDNLRSNDLKNINPDINPRDILKENVLSLRLINPIIKQWKNQGFKKSLDYYLYKNYVSRSDARPEEKELIYSVLRGYGFFEDVSKWPKISELDSVDIDAGSFKRDGKNIEMEKDNLQVETEIISNRKIIELLFGPAPERENIREDIFTKFRNSVKNIEKDDLNFKKEVIRDLLNDIDDDFLRDSGVSPEKLKGNVESILSN